MRDPGTNPEVGDVIVGKSGMVRTIVRIDDENYPNPCIVFVGVRNGVTHRPVRQRLVHWKGWCFRNRVSDN